MKLSLCIIGAGLILAWTGAGAQEKWVVHEWGTFTSLQDESGTAIGGINTDDEPVPPFVHRMSGFALLNTSETPPVMFKGAPACHPDVTMRLETPVIYFHPPKSAAGTRSASVRVAFHGGWLSEFYPAANFTAPGLENDRLTSDRLLPDSESKLEWNDLQIGGYWPVTDTTAQVWTSPRAVESESVHTTNGESEKFLFYRGVANLNAPLQVSRNAQSGELLFKSQLEGLPGSEPLPIKSLWLVDIQPDRQIAFRALPPVSLIHNSQQYVGQTAADFAPGDYRLGNLDKLKAALLSALVSEGLFPDEAQALLNTWEVSYFKSSGMRLFFLVPRTWTDFYLPLEISRPSDLRRVMVGRIELVTPRQRSRLQAIAGYSTNEINRDALQLIANYCNRFLLGTTNQSNAQTIAQIHQEMAQVNEGQKPLSAFISVPRSYQTYLDLGRFRNALVLNEARDRPTAGLTDFITTYRLEGYRPATPPRLLSFTVGTGDTGKR